MTSNVRLIRNDGFWRDVNMPRPEHDDFFCTKLFVRTRIEIPELLPVRAKFSAERKEDMAALNVCVKTFVLDPDKTIWVYQEE